VPRRADDAALAGRTVLAVFAHPDDEALACGGTIARLADAGARVVLLCATRGEAGSTSDSDLVPGGDLGAARARELHRAARILGVAEIVLLGHHDGRLRWAEVTALGAEILLAIGRCRPDAVITFAEDGLYWHPDHIGVHERTTMAVRAAGGAAPALYYVTLPRGAIRGLTEAARTREGAPADASFWGLDADAFGDAAPLAGFAVDVRPWAARKLAALREHRTQMGRRNPIWWIDEPAARRWLGVELFRRAGTGTEPAGPLEPLAAPALEEECP